MALSSARKILVRVANLIRLAIDRELDMLLCDHLCRLIGWMVSDLVRSRATLEAEIWTLPQKKRSALSSLGVAIFGDTLPSCSMCRDRRRRPGVVAIKANPGKYDGACLGTGTTAYLTGDAPQQTHKRRVVMVGGADVCSHGKTLILDQSPRRSVGGSPVAWTRSY